MKDLISIFNYSPDNRRKQILNDLLISLQPLRNNFDLMVVSHSSISDMSLGLVDYFYFDSNNELISDFNLTNKFWFRSPEFAINSSLVYPVSTHLAIYSLFYYTFDFAFHKNYNKIHFIEFDIVLKDINLINEVNKDLDENDGVMFHGSEQWALGTYFASTLKGFTRDRFVYDREKILSQLSESDSRMTERVTPVIICRDRKIKFREYLDLNDGNDCQKNDEHKNYTLKWAVPIVLRNTNEVNFFIYNEVGTNHVVDLFVNNNHMKFEVNQGPGIWNLTPIGNIDEINEILIFIDKVMTNKILLNEQNREEFKKNNFLVYLENEN
jgi:hypothetical protein